MIKMKIRNEKDRKKNNVLWSLYNKQYEFYFDTYSDCLAFVKENNIEIEKIYDCLNKNLEGGDK
jgi:hypothetical protein